ncbi:MAG TPA: hypothetical protein VJK72_02805 [Candidatus Nanoarchaeia archaeon]|nr:hypothetical protein [Candidatus Nanoarchaeia archaeon]
MKISKRKLLDMSEISLILDGYDDIFSDFDPRDYSVRALSVDFLHEAERASREKVDHPHLSLLTPAKIRSKPKEEIIRKRLKHHFKKHFQRVKHQYRKTIFHGLCFTFAGVVCMLLAVYVVHSLNSENIFNAFLRVLLEPSGWFLFWEGLVLIVFESQKIKPELHFYSKMSTSQIRFLGY